MLDIQYIKDNTKQVKDSLSTRKINPETIDELINLHDKWTEKLNSWEKLRQKRNEIAHGGKFSEEGKSLKEELVKVELELQNAKKEYDKIAYEIPNIPLKDVPKGIDPKVIKEGNPTKFNFKPKDHVELGTDLNIIDVQRAAKVSGSRFAYLKNEGALLEFAIVQFVMENLVKEGFSPIIPPALVRKEITYDLGYWHGGGNENYYLVHDVALEGPEKGTELPLYLIGTGEHAVVPMHMNEIFGDDELPKKYAAFSPCFRREAGAAGKDTKGILRVHQFDKIEMVQFVKPEDDEKQRRKMLAIAENLTSSLGLPYQVVVLGSEDLGFPSAETIDIETWIPSQEAFRETHSISTTTDFQARRLKIRYRKGKTTELVHILNGTAFAIGRTLIAIMENYQQKDGSIQIPKALQKYAGFTKIPK